MTQPDKRTQLTELIQRGARLAEERRALEIDEDQLERISGGAGILGDPDGGGATYTFGMMPKKQPTLAPF